MCGIAGLVSLSSSAIPHLQKRMRVMNDAIAHRGPDGEGFWSHETGRLGLSHRRLSIIDLDKRSAQPMRAQSGNMLTFNGEIYNYVELEKELSSAWNYQTRSDTESILAAYAKYGQSCLDHLRGMFAFALWNESEKTLFAAVDPMGIKPFYYTIQDDIFYFASEMKALLPFLPSIETDRHGLTEYVAFQLPISEQTLFKGVRRLLPGNKLIVKNGKIKISEYWTAKYVTEADAGKLSPGDVIDKARQVIDQSVTQHLRSDVPVGSYLSGGVDSGLIATLATDHDAGAGLCFHGKFTDYPGHDESHHARAIAEKNNLTLHETVITADDFKDNVKNIIYHLDTPVAGVGSFPQYMVSKLAKSHVKVVLGGQGGDELFGGYARYLVGYLDALIGAGLDGQLDDPRFPISMGELAPNLTLLRDYKPMLKKFWGGGLFEDFTHRYFRLCDRSLDLKDEIDRDILVEDHAFETFAEVFDRENAVADKNPINQMLHFDMKRLLPGLLQVEDRMSMAHGLEARVPLVDREVAELAMSIPASIKFAGGQMKSILKDAFGDRLPRSVLNREDKMGFPVPISHWYKKELSGFMEDVFESDAARSRGIFNTKKIIENLDKDLPFSRKTWGLLSLELWHQNFHDRSGDIKFDPSKVN